VVLAENIKMNFSDVIKTLNQASGRTTPPLLSADPKKPMLATRRYGALVEDGLNLISHNSDSSDVCNPIRENINDDESPYV